MASINGLMVVAEGVETEEQRQMVVDSQVDQIQGFYYARPMPEEEFKTFLKHSSGQIQKQFI